MCIYHKLFAQFYGRNDSVITQLVPCLPPVIFLLAESSILNAHLVNFSVIEFRIIT